MTVNLNRCVLYVTEILGGEEDRWDAKARESDRQPEAEEHPEPAGQGGSPSLVTDGRGYETPSKSSEQAAGEWDCQK